MSDEKDSMKMLLNLTKQKNSKNDSNGNNEYNIFNVLGIEYREVLICRFIGNLLDPHGTHGMGNDPLKLFIENVINAKEKLSRDELSNAVIMLEEHIDDERRVDIAIHIGKTVYPIEVKIWADDQECQLQDYYKYFFKDGNHKIYYLTPLGWEPSKKSKGKLNDEQIVCLSFENDISEWLKNIKESCNGEVKLVIKNFIEVIEKMCANNKELECILSALSLNKNDNYEKSDMIDSAIILMKHCDDIWSKIRKNYLLTKLDYDKKLYKCIDCLDCDKEIDKHALLRIVKVSDDKNPIALICVETNLYITVKKDCINNSDGEWKPYQNSNYVWKYITPPKQSGDKFALNKPTILPDGNIDIRKTLNEISNTTQGT